MDIVLAVLSQKEIIIISVAGALFLQSALAILCFHLLLKLEPSKKTMLIWNFILVLLIFIGPIAFGFYYLSAKKRAKQESA